MAIAQEYYEGPDVEMEGLHNGENQVFLKKCLNCKVFTGSIKVIVENDEVAEVVVKSEGVCSLNN